MYHVPFKNNAPILSAESDKLDLTQQHQANSTQVKRPLSQCRIKLTTMHKNSVKVGRVHIYLALESCLSGKEGRTRVNTGTDREGKIYVFV